MFEIFGFIIPLIVILVIVGIFLSFVPLGLWISAVSAGVRVNIFSLVGMRLRRVRADKIIRPLIKAQKAGMDVNANQLESHLLSGGRVDTDRASALILDEFRGGKAGKISLETPPVGRPEHA